MSTQIINYQLSQLFIMFAWRKGSDSEALKPMFTWDLVTANSGPFICLLFVKESERLHFEVFRLWSPNIPNKPISQTWIHSHQKMVSHEGFKVNQKQKRHSKNTHTHRQSTIYHPTNHSETNQQEHQILSFSESPSRSFWLDNQVPNINKLLPGTPQTSDEMSTSDLETLNALFETNMTIDDSLQSYLSSQHDTQEGWSLRSASTHQGVHQWLNTTDEEHT